MLLLLETLDETWMKAFRAGTVNLCYFSGNLRTRRDVRWLLSKGHRARATPIATQRPEGGFPRGNLLGETPRGAQGPSVFLDDQGRKVEGFTS